MSSHAYTYPTVIESRRAGRTDRLTELAYELLDAHADTERLARTVGEDLGWAAHLAYLRDLQRVGREALARLGSSPVTAQSVESRA